MIDFADKEALKRIDPRDALQSTELLVKQCETAWNDVQKLDLARIEGIKNVVFCGMGASIYGAIVLKSLLGRTMPFPIELVSDYFLPDYVGKDTLVVLTSYSGTTEEVLACAEAAKASQAQMVVLTKGGQLAEFAKDNNVPAYIFDGKLNIAGAPRGGCGYTIFGLIALLDKLNIIDLEEKEIENSFIRFVDKFDDIKEQALSDYQLFMGKIPIIFSAEHLSGNALILRNQFNETSKNFSTHFLIPDLNHHLMEGLQFPADAPLHFIVFNSKNYSDKIQRRIALTSEVVKQNNYPIHTFTTNGQSFYDDILETLVYGSFLSLYLGLEYKQNPATNPYVDWFKQELAK